jgi:glycosyltransferase involved in cell wall biosynthesis
MANENIKVLHLIDSGGLYGAEKMLLALVSEQIKHGIEPMIFSVGEPGIGPKPLEVEASRSGLPVTPWRMKPGFNLMEALKIMRWATDHDYSLLHSHGYKFDILFGLLPIKIRGLPIISTVHGYVKAKFPRKIWFYELLDRIALRSVDHVIFVRKGMELDVGSLCRSSVIPNGISLEQKTHNASLSSDIQGFISNHNKLIVAVGRLSKEKGFDVLVNAFAMLTENHSDVGLVIAGEGQDRQRIEELVENLRLPKNVSIPGYVSNIPELLDEADALVIPSFTEGLPMVLLEAMQARCPVVATSVGGIPEVLDYGNAGFLIPRGDPVALFRELAELLETTEQIEPKINHAFHRLVAEYSAEAMSLSYKKIYSEILDN